MTYRIIGDQRERGIEWAVKRFAPSPGNWDKASALILERDGDITAVVVYNYWFPKDSVQISVASAGGRWLTRPFLTAVFRNPFVAWDMRRVGASIAANNIKSIRFCEHLGFVREGTIREGSGPGIDTYLYGMLKSECRFLGTKYVEAKRTTSAKPNGHGGGVGNGQCWNGSITSRTQ